MGAWKLCMETAPYIDTLKCVHLARALYSMTIYGNKQYPLHKHLKHEMKLIDSYAGLAVSLHNHPTAVTNNYYFLLNIPVLTF